MQIQWYPGHMAKAKRLLKEQLKLVDLVIEVLDARIPRSSSNPEFANLVGKKPRIIVLNKEDLAEAEENIKWINYFQTNGFLAIKMNSTNRKGVDVLFQTIKKAVSERQKNLVAKGLLPRPTRAMVVGIPNVGKSSLINNLVQRGSAKTGKKPGVTKGQQWIRLLPDLELLDTPGLLWPKFEEPQVGFHLALIGAISDQVFDVTEVAVKFIEFLRNVYPSALIQRYKLERLEGDSYLLLEQIGRKRGLIGTGGTVEIDKAALTLLQDFRQGKLGRITLEKI